MLSQGGKTHAGCAGTYLLVVPWDLDAPGGVNQVVLNLYRQLERSQALKPHVLVLDWSARRPVDGVYGSQVRVTRMRVRPVLGRGWLAYELVRYALLSVTEMRRLRALVRRLDVRVVNCHYVGPESLAWIVAKLLRVFRGKVLLSIHGLDARSVGAERGARRRLWRFALETADAVTAVSQKQANQTLLEVGLSGRNVYVLGNGVDPEDIYQLSALPPETSVRRPYLLSLGTFEYKKGHDVLIRAFAQVARTHPTLSLVIAGRADDDSEFVRLDELRESLGVGDATILLRNVRHAEAMRLLAGSELLILASRQEPFGIVVLEAGVLSRPVVATDVCGVVEHLRADEELVVVPAEDEKALARAIDRILVDALLARMLGNRLQRAVLARFTWKAVLTRYLSLI